ncbi:MAG: ribosome-binding factor A [Patescibacteria group bacterium]
MSKVPRVNDLLLTELAAIVNREVAIPGALITISYVACSSDLKQARVGFSVLPDRLAGTALRRLAGATGAIISLLRPRVKLRKLPHLLWEFDATEKEADKIEKLIAGLDQEDQA